MPCREREMRGLWRLTPGSAVKLYTIACSRCTQYSSRDIIKPPGGAWHPKRVRGARSIVLLSPLLATLYFPSVSWLKSLRQLLLCSTEKGRRGVKIQKFQVASRLKSSMTQTCHQAKYGCGSCKSYTRQPTNTLGEKRFQNSKYIGLLSKNIKFF